jgi:hypothetical protein
MDKYGSLIFNNKPYSWDSHNSPFCPNCSLTACALSPMSCVCCILIIICKNYACRYSKLKWASVSNYLYGSFSFSLYIEFVTFVAWLHGYGYGCMYFIQYLTFVDTFLLILYVLLFVVGQDIDCFFCIFWGIFVEWGATVRGEWFDSISKLYAHWRSYRVRGSWRYKIIELQQSTLLSRDSKMPLVLSFQLFLHGIWKKRENTSIYNLPNGAVLLKP